jgi:hypothetical protein
VTRVCTTCFGCEGDLDDPVAEHHDRLGRRSEMALDLGRAVLKRYLGYGRPGRCNRRVPGASVRPGAAAADGVVVPRRRRHARGCSSRTWNPGRRTCASGQGDGAAVRPGGRATGVAPLCDPAQCLAPRPGCCCPPHGTARSRSQVCIDEGPQLGSARAYLHWYTAHSLTSSHEKFGLTIPAVGGFGC